MASFLASFIRFSGGSRGARRFHGVCANSCFGSDAPRIAPPSAGLGVLPRTHATSARFDADLSDWVGLHESLSSPPL